MSALVTGMLWYDPSSKPLLERVRKAAVFHAEKYGVPRWVELAPEDATVEDAVRIQTELGLAVRIHKGILPNNFWIGMEEGGDVAG